MSSELKDITQDWGMAAAGAFVSTTHHEPTAALDPSKVKLRTPFVVCIVGASRGIGAGVAYSYAKAGATGLILASRRTSGLEETAAKCRAINPAVDTSVFPCDITSADSVRALAEHAQERFDRLDVVVVNSGVSGPVVLRLTETDPETFQTASDVNYVGTFLCAKFLVPLLLRTGEDRGGARTFIAVNTVGSLIVRGPIANAQYCVSKMAQLRLVEYVHEQFAADGLVAYAVHPGAVLSEMAQESAPEAFLSYLVDSPELCGAFCVWLTKDGAAQGKKWLSGRFVDANWDVDELEAKREEVVKKDLLKFRLAV